MLASPPCYRLVYSMLDSPVVFKSLPLDYSMSFPLDIDVISTKWFGKYMENPC